MLFLSDNKFVRVFLVGRFLDDAEFMKEAEGFTQRNHVFNIPYIITLFIVSLILSLYSFFYIAPINQFWFVLSITTILFFLVIVVVNIIQKSRGVINALQFQNAIFSGAAKLVTEFCIIVRKDGKIVYIDSDYRTKFLVADEKRITIDSLFKQGIVSKKELEKLKNAMTKGLSKNIIFNVPNSELEKEQLEFSLKPVGVSLGVADNRTVKLAVDPILRPSGYFLLEAPKENKPKSVEDKKIDLIKKFVIGGYTVNKEGFVSEIDADLEVSLGYSAGEILSLGLKFIDLFYDEDVVLKILSSKNSWQAILLLRNKDNMIISSMVDYNIVKGKNGQIIRSYGFVTPFAEANVFNDDSVTNRNSAFDLVNNTPIATAILDIDGVIKRSNKSFREMVNKADIYDSNVKLQDFIADEGKEDLKKLFDSVISGKASGSEVLDVKIMDDAETTASLYLNRIINNNSLVGGIIVHLIDTTELKNLEMRFVHSQKMQAVGQLAGGIAHDFNNLLTAMMGFCDLLLMRHPAGDASFADIMQIKQNANRAANLVRQLLAFSRKQTLQPKIINLTDVLADLSNLIGRLIGENIELKMEYGRDIGYVKVDQGQLEQVIINLAVNARDAMSDGGTLTVRTSDVVIDSKSKLHKSLIPPSADDNIEKGEYVLVEVIDTGCGIDNDQIGKIFEPFYSTKEIGAGTGLGLSTVYGIIKQTDGYIYVSSNIGKGTNFSIFLKRYHKLEEKKVGINGQYEKMILTDLSGEGTILLVEDETPVRIFSNSALVGKGYKVLEAECAESALAIVEKNGNKIDLIITDVVMPGISGPDMVKQIYKKYPNIKVIFMSGYGEDAFVESFGEDRKFHFLSKPYTLKQLATKVKEVMKN
jgi:two-component system cell cycle sensor histidine kinase/response regulator CckA